MKRSKMAAAVMVAAGLGFGGALLIGMGPREPVQPAQVVGVCNNSQFVYRAWSDGRVEVNDTQDIMGGQEAWKGWKLIK